MADHDQEVPESPATWENVIVGKAKQAVGRAFGDEELSEEGEEQADTAHEVRDEFEAEQHGR